jgi:hypothetical protein
MVPIVTEGNVFNAAGYNAGYFSEQTLLILMFVQRGNENLATVTGISARFDNVPENFFREEVSKEWVVDVVLATEAHGVD